MKKILAIALVLCLAVGMLAGCAKPAAPAAEKKFKVAMICDSSISDGGWGAACYNGMTAAAEKRGWETAYTDSIDQSAYADTMISYCDLGYDMIFAPGNQYSDAVKQVAADYPNVAFAVLNGSTELPTANIMSILPNADQIGSIAGIIAGLMSKSNVIGFIGGMELDTTKSKLAQFTAAAQVINPAIKVVSAYAGSFNDTAKGMELAASMINEGADVFFGDASAVDSGARQAIDQANGDTVKIFDIGQPADKYDVTFENCQARVRTLELMDYANKNGGFVIGTGDLSELALGWATYNGDHMSMYGVNTGVPKTLVRHIVQYVADTCGNDTLRDVLVDILDTPVSPELLPTAADGTIAQQTEKLVGPYELHDFYLYYVLRFGFSPTKIYHLARTAFDGRYEPEVLLAWLKNFYRRFFAQQFKRSCLPDGPKVGSVTLSPRGDWRMPSDACNTLWMAELEKLEV